jgi:GT2 family glycosyltransferase/SAM-dependent methyltransferase
MEERGSLERIRRATAPRLIDWTGERMVPWTPDVQVVYEHLHRYDFAASIVAGRSVLDLGSGEGYGSALLASVAERVCGIDIDERTVQHSAANYHAPNLEFRVGSASDLSQFGDGEFGAVVCFEVVEHLAEQEEMVAEIARVLRPDGLLLISTPEVTSYTELTGQENPFHVRELTAAEFRPLIGRHLPHIRVWGQRTVAGSVLYPLDTSERGLAHHSFIEPEGDGWRPAADPIPMYLIALASREPLDARGPSLSVCADATLRLVRAAERRSADRLQAAHHREAQLTDATISARADRDALRTNLAASEEHLAHAAQRIETAADAEALAARVSSSISWRLLERARGRLVRPDGRRTLLGRVISAALRTIGRGRGAPADALAPDGPGVAEVQMARKRGAAIAFPVYKDCRVSIVIPIHNQAQATRRCLASIAHRTHDVQYEVIAVDDASDEPALHALFADVAGIRVLRNPENRGFLGSVNAGLGAARGEYVVFLNNDTEVFGGWLAELVETADAHRDADVVCAKILQPDGTLQEAGGIVWNDGSARHVGRGQSPGDPAYNYVREVDYGSGACLLVRASLLAETGGFDDRYAPAYYEDVDLCFEARARGRRVLYQPHCTVIHYEGTSHGVDMSEGTKANQVRNQEIFAGKWREQLEDQPAPDPEDEYRLMDRCHHQHVLVVDQGVPRALEDAGSLRMREILLALRRLGCRVTMLPDDRQDVQPYTRELQQEGIEVLYGGFPDRGVIYKLGPSLSLAILSRPTVAWRYLYLLREYAPDARIVYDTVDLHYLREHRRAALGDDPALRRVGDAFRELELGLIRSCDETLTVSEEERRTILDELPGATIRVLPTINRPIGDVPPAPEREGILYVGGFHHPPNVDAARRLVLDILPIVRRELPDVAVRIVGSNPPPAVRELADVEGVEVLGFVEDLGPLLRESRVMAAPLVYGAGVKGKITQSLAAGLPVVTTAVGAEGLSAVSGRELLVAENDEDIAAGIVRVCREDELWTQFSERGLQLAADRFSPDVAYEILRDLVDAEAPVAAR